MDTTRDAEDRAEDLQDVLPVRDQDATAIADADADPAQVEWEQSERETAGSADSGPDPAGIPDLAGGLLAEDLSRAERQPETQDATPIMAELGPDGEGDVTAQGV